MFIWTDSGFNWDILAIPAGLFYAILTYQLVISLRGLQRVPELPQANAYLKFVVIVPAHNEEKVIGYLLDSLRSQSYPSSFYDVYVSCDNCSDRTAEIAESQGFTVLIRSAEGQSGKTWNMRWAMSQIPLNEYDALIMFDADNLVAPEFLEKMNDYLGAHPEAEAVQGYLDVKNPDDSWVTRAYALSYWYCNRFWQLARHRWGLSAQLGGTGLLVRTSCIERYGWDMRSLTEDLEFTALLISKGSRVHWNQHAVIYDEKPVSLKASFKQRMRWMQGHYWVFWTYGRKHLIQFFRTGKIQYFDIFLYLLQPGRAAVSYVSMLAGVLILIAQAIAYQEFTTISAVWLVYLALSITQVVFFVIIAPSIRLKRVTFRYVPDVLGYFWYGLTWAPIVIKGIFVAQNQRTWVKTEHTRELGINDLMK